MLCNAPVSLDYPYAFAGGRCRLNVVPGYDKCYQHADIPKRVVDRLSEGEADKLGQWIANGVTQKMAGERLGLTPGQVQAVLKQGRRTPRPWELSEPDYRDLRLSVVAVMRTEKGWTRLYGPTRREKQ